MSKGVPAHLLLGTLGSGKTTTILKLLSDSPPVERWAVYVNEFGSVGLDKALMGEEYGLDERLYVHEVPGGCICCSAQTDLEAGIRSILEKVNPDRILIEPTGLADAETLVRQIEEKGPDWGIALYSVIGHIDVRLCRNPRIMQVPFWNSLVQSCNDLIGTKTDKTTVETIETFARTLAPMGRNLRSLHLGRDSFLSMDWKAPCRLQNTVFGKLDGEWALPRPHPHGNGIVQETAFLDGAGICFEAVGKSHYSLGWRINTDVAVRLEQLERWLQECRKNPLPPMRLKGILRTDKGWYQVQLVNGDEPEIVPAAGRKDSRLELISSVDSGGWRSFEKLWFKDPVVPLVGDNLDEPS